MNAISKTFEVEKISWISATWQRNCFQILQTKFLVSSSLTGKWLGIVQKLFIFFILLIYQNFIRPDKGECSKLDIEKMKRHLDRVKNAKHPMCPKTIGELKELFKKQDILESYGYNLKATERLYIDTIVDESFAFSLFASFSIMKFITEHIDPTSRNYLIDGTFSRTPRLFYQILIISIEYKNDVSS